MSPTAAVRPPRAQSVFVLNGPSLNRLGTREPHIYGTTTLAQIEALCREALTSRPLVFRQSNSEGELVDWVHEAIDGAAAIVVNPAALSFTSIALLDALKMFPAPLVEVHLTNIHRREAHYHRSFVSLAATGVIAGLGPAGYVAALQAALALLGEA